MVALIYDSFKADLTAGNVVPTTASFKAMLVTSAYTPNAGTHAKRSDVTNEASGSGYTSGGVAVTCSVATNTTTHVTTLTFQNPSWSTATITARAVVIYKTTGVASTDNLVAYADFGGADATSTAGTFSVTLTPLTLT